MSLQTFARNVFALGFVWWLTATATAQDRIADTVHNLSASSPSAIRAADERQICIFCHAPHHTSGLRPLWNREMPTTNYTIYESSTLDAQAGQPTGASKLCLSCHDGTIALGSVLSRADRIRMVGGDFLPAGLSNLGTDLSDDHPVSFYYTSGLAASDQQLQSPLALPSEVRLDASGQMQCTACHDPHNNQHGNFLVRGNEFGFLCLACHQMDGWSVTTHRTSAVNVSQTSSADWPYPSVTQNACANCHRPHTAGGKQRLLIFGEEEANCLDCHGGQPGIINIQVELDKFSAHDPRNYLGVHDPAETFSNQTEHVECVDCHNPHATSGSTSGSGYTPISATMLNVRGVSIGGTEIAKAQNEYEVCFRCHGDSAVAINKRVVRQADTNNLRLKFSPGNVSYHPVVSSAPSPDTVSLIPGMASGTLIRCTDCHNSENAVNPGGQQPVGPHGSINDYLLERNYTVADNIAEAEFEYAMCYKCHQRTSILGDESFSEHRMHIVEENSPCSACHDPHGISSTVATGTGDHTHLINFDPLIVSPGGMGRMEFRDTGSFSGSCTLVCHGERHQNKRYSRGGGMGGGH